MRPTRFPSTMPCLWPRPERGSTNAASPGSARLMAMPLGTSSAAPGASVIGEWMQARSEDLDVESLQTKSRLAPWQHLRDVLDQLARQHDLGRERQLVHTLLVEKRERVGVLAESLLREVRGEERNSLFLALRLRVRLEVFSLGGESDAKRPLRERRDLAEDVGIGRELDV